MYSKYYNETSNKYKFNIIIKFLKKYHASHFFKRSYMKCSFKIFYLNNNMACIQNTTTKQATNISLIL